MLQYLCLIAIARRLIKPIKHVKSFCMGCISRRQWHKSTLKKINNTYASGIEFLDEKILKFKDDLEKEFFTKP